MVDKKAGEGGAKGRGCRPLVRPTAGAGGSGGSPTAPRGPPPGGRPGLLDMLQPRKARKLYFFAFAFFGPKGGLGFEPWTLEHGDQGHERMRETGAKQKQTIVMIC